ncbi:MAG: transglutaminase domain-containing protein [Crocinitomicaceae bacterium]
MFKLFFLLICFLSLQVFGSNGDEKISRKTLRSIPLLTQHLTKDATSNTEKVELIYKWITHNIAYDYDQLQSEDYFVGVDPTAILRQKKAICHGYAELMKAMLDEVGIENETIDGYVHDVYWTPGTMVLKQSHTWIAFYVDGQWHLADPTWDAGYIGRLPIDKKPYKAKKYIQNKFKNSERETRVKVRRVDREEKRKQDYDDQPDFKDEIGFVKQPQSNYFFFESDSFLLSHLPVNPYWQLRNDFISLQDFALPTDSLKMRLAEVKDVNYQYEKKIGDFLKQDYLHQLISSAEDGYDYNPYNPGIKTLNYYNFLVLVQNKKLQKLARGSVYELTPDKYPSLIQKNDTVMKYNKLLKSFSSSNYKAVRGYDKENYKATMQTEKVISKSMRTLTLENDKLVSFTETSAKKIEANMITINREIETIELKYPGINANSISSSRKKSSMWSDSLKLQFKQLTAIDSAFISMYTNSKFNEVLNDVTYLNYLMKFNAEVIKFNSHVNNSKIAEIDSIICDKSAHSIMLYKDSVKFEVINNNVIGIVKKAKSYTRSAMTDFKTSKSRNTDDVLMIQGEMLALLKLAQKVNANCINFNNEVLSVMEDYKEIKSLNNLAENQKKLKEEKNDYIKEESKVASERDRKLSEDIANKTRKWKKMFKVKMSE